MSAQQEILRIDHRPEGYGSSRYETLTASVGNEYSGRLIYDWSISGACWELETLEVREAFQRRGIGAALLQSFAREVGADQPVRTNIIHHDTVAVLIEKYKAAGAEGTYLVPEEELDEIPFARLLGSGGIDVKSITVTPNPNPVDLKDPYEIVLWGRTR